MASATTKLAEIVIEYLDEEAARCYVRAEEHRVKARDHYAFKESGKESEEHLKARCLIAAGNAIRAAGIRVMRRVEGTWTVLPKPVLDDD